MSTEITPLAVIEEYQALTILTEGQLNEAMNSIQDYCNIQLRLNLVQLAVDVFGDTYIFNDDGAPTRTPVTTDYADKSANETITGLWTFNNQVLLNQKVTSTNIFTSTGQYKARSYLDSANQTIPNAIATPINWDANAYNTGNLHSTSLNPSRFTIPSGGNGLYIFNCQVTFAANSTGRRELYVYKNGSKIAECKLFNPDASQQSVLNLFASDNCSANDNFEFYVYQNSTGTLDVVKDDFVSFATVLKVW